MNRTLGVALAALMVMAGALGLAAPATAAKMAMCRVCVVNHGEGAPEEVKATRTHQDKEYGFCSEKCAQLFDADPAAYVEPEFPRPAPPFEVRELSGKAITSESLKGKVVLLDFWATWCKPCIKSMPELQSLHDRYAARGLVVLGVSIDVGGTAKVKKHLAAKKFTYPIAMDSEKQPAWEAYGVKAVPAAFLLDREGRIVAQWTGSPPADLTEKLDALLAAGP